MLYCLKTVRAQSVWIVVELMSFLLYSAGELASKNEDAPQAKIFPSQPTSHPPFPLCQPSLCQPNPSPPYPIISIHLTHSLFPFQVHPHKWRNFREPVGAKDESKLWLDRTFTP
jgi:hypothetical protein